MDLKNLLDLNFVVFRRCCQLMVRGLKGCNESLLVGDFCCELHRLGLNPFWRLGGEKRRNQISKQWKHGAFCLLGAPCIHTCESNWNMVGLPIRTLPTELPTKHQRQKFHCIFLDCLPRDLWPNLCQKLWFHFWSISPYFTIFHPTVSAWFICAPKSTARVAIGVEMQTPSDAVRYEVTYTDTTR